MVSPRPRASLTEGTVLLIHPPATRRDRYLAIVDRTNPVWVVRSVSDKRRCLVCGFNAASASVSMISRAGGGNADARTAALTSCSHAMLYPAPTDLKEYHAHGGICVRH